MHSITVKAPAKVNLFLEVLSKRKDSYHNIITLFERISLADALKISRAAKGITIKSDVLITKDPKDNLVHKAAAMILKRGKVSSGVKIDIKKRIPVASGLGGGSSDAAAALIGINKLFSLRLNNKALSVMARELGADVPFFVSGAPFAIGRGRGDEIEAIRSSKRFWHLIVKAGSKAATKEIYEAFDTEFAANLKRLTPRPGSVKIHPLSKLRIDHESIESILYNDLEKSASLRIGLIGSTLKSLAQLLDKKVIVSGSGPSLFCLYRTRREAIRAKEIVLKSLPARSRAGWQIFVVRTQH